MHLRSFVRLGAVALFSLSLTSIASAQATRTWVSGVGDDVNPCSRTAPCKTFAGAISKTASGGEIDVIDPGGFGAVTITKAITIDGGPFQAGILSSGTQGVVINIAAPTATSVVNLRNLMINGAGTTLGTNGVNFVSGAGLNMDNVTVFNYSSRALRVDSTTAATFNIRNCHFWNTQATAIAFNPISSTAHKAIISESNISNNGISAGSAGGVFAANGAKVKIFHSIVSGNTAPGVEAGTGGEIFVDESSLDFNQFGARTSGGTVFLSRSSIYGSTGGSAVSNGGGTIFTFGDNRMGGNGTNNTGTAASPGLQ